VNRRGCLGASTGAVLVMLVLLSGHVSAAANPKLIGGWLASTEIDGKQRGHWLELNADGTWRRIEDHFGFRAEDHGRWLPDGDGAILEEVRVRLHLAEGKLLLVYRGRTLYAFQPCPTIPKPLDELPPFPHTLSETVAILTAELPERERTVLAGTLKEDLVRFHHGLGTYIRNRFGLWGANPALRAACKVSHPDDASAVILRALRDHLRNTRPGGRELDYLEGILQGLSIAPTAVRQMTVARLVDTLNHESRRALRRKGVLEDALVFELARPSNEDERRKAEEYWLNDPPGLRAWGQGEKPSADTRPVDLLIGFRKWLLAPNRVMLEPTFDPRLYQTPQSSPDFASIRWRDDWFEMETSVEQGKQRSMRVDAWSMLGPSPPMSVEQAAQYAGMSRERAPAAKTPIEIAITGEPRDSPQEPWAWSYVVRSACEAPFSEVRPPAEIGRDSIRTSQWTDLAKPPRLSASAALARFRGVLARAAQPSQGARVEIHLNRVSASAWYYQISLEDGGQQVSGYVTMNGRVALAKTTMEDEVPATESAPE